MPTVVNPLVLQEGFAANKKLPETINKENNIKIKDISFFIF